MNRTLRISLTVTGIVVALLIVTPFLIPVDSLRPTIERTVSAALGRPVVLGRLRLSLFNGSLSADTLTVADDPAFSKAPFLTARSINVGIELRPLIVSRSLHVTRITIDQPEVTLIRNAAGHWNYSSLGASSDGSGGSSGSSIETLELRDGRIIVASAPSQKRITYNHVKVVASDVSSVSKGPITATAALPGGGAFTLAGTMGPVNHADAFLTPLDATIAIHRLDLATAGFLRPSAGLGGLLDLRATIASTNGGVNASGSATLSKALFVAGGSPASGPVVVEFNTRYDLRTHAGALNSSTLRTGGAVARLHGSYDAAGDDTRVNIAVVGEHMPATDLESFLPALGIHLPNGANLTAGTFAANLTVVGTPGSMVTTGTVDLANARLSGFDLGSKMRTISTLAGLHPGKDLDIETLTTTVRIARQGLRFDHFNAVVPSLGSLTGAGTIDARNALDFKMVATLANGLAGATNGLGGAAGAAVGTAGTLDGVLGVLTGGEASSGQSAGQRVPFLVKGTTSDPQFIPDVGGLVLHTLQEQLGAKGTSTPAGPDLHNANPLGVLGGLLNTKKH